MSKLEEARQRWKSDASNRVAEDKAKVDFQVLRLAFAYACRRDLLGLLSLPDVRSGQYKINHNDSNNLDDCHSARLHGHQQDNPAAWMQNILPLALCETS